MPATASTRSLWKGAIAFGLVHIPISLHSAVRSQSLDFDWLDRRSMEPVGYKRINKVTGKEIDRADIVKGIAHDEGEYVILEADEIAAAYPRTTQTVEIEAFVPLDDIPFVFLERPYYVAPVNKGAKVYALLREVLAESRLAGLAKVVIQTKQHLAVLFPCGPVLILNLLRWGDEVREWEGLNLPARDKKALGLSEKELEMGRQLVSDMTVKWEPDHYTDSFREQILQLVQEKVDAGETEQVTKPEPEESETGTARIYDLTEMLQRSLKGRKSDKSADDSEEETADAKPARKSSSKASGTSARKSITKTGTSARKSAAKKANPTGTATASKSAAKKSASKTSKSATKPGAKTTTSGRTSKQATAESRRLGSRKKKAA